MTKDYIPLAERLRPEELCDVVGQEHLTGENGIITTFVKKQRPLSFLLYGPPGCGKTSIARLYAKSLDLPFFQLSAVWDGIAELKKIVHDLVERPLLGKSVLLFVDEVHRFNKAQQDAFLPFVEKGTIVLIAATAENPSFYLNPALLSRLQVFTLHPLTVNSLETLLVRYEKKYGRLPLTPQAKEALFEYAHGDARYLFNLLENIEQLPQSTELDLTTLNQLLPRRMPLYDRDKEYHYQLISSLHKSVRGSDPDAALYWLCRMLKGGEDPLFLARRIIRMATEDVGLADPQALSLAIAARDTYQALGSPEGELALAQAVVYLALAPKSNSIYIAYGKASQEAERTGHLPPPSIIINATNAFMRGLGYGKGYIYDHDTQKGCSGQRYFPDDLETKCYYEPQERGFEREMKKRLDYFKKIRHSHSH